MKPLPGHKNGSYLIKEEKHAAIKYKATLTAYRLYLYLFATDCTTFSRLKKLLGLFCFLFFNNIFRIRTIEYKIIRTVPKNQEQLQIASFF